MTVMSAASFVVPSISSTCPEPILTLIGPFSVGTTKMLYTDVITATTTFSGVSAEEQSRKQARATRLYARRGFGPEGVAAEIVSAVRRNRPVVPVTAEAKAARLASRVAPGLLRAFAKLDVS